jgi:hypothetical protein
MAKKMSERKKGEFPSQTIPNPGGQEQLKAMCNAPAKII